MSVLTIANWFIHKANNENVRLDQIKLMMLVYIAQGFALVETNEILFHDAIEAWQYGPIIPSLYRECRMFGMDRITVKNLVGQGETVADDDATIKAILLRVWAATKNYTGIQLCNWGHNEDGPWYEVWERDGGKKLGNRKIPSFLMYKYFKKI